MSLPEPEEFLPEELADEIVEDFGYTALLQYHESLRNSLIAIDGLEGTVLRICAERPTILVAPIYNTSILFH